jgi:hypothetical protein
VIGLRPAVLAMGVVLGALLAAYFAVSHRRAVRADG